MHLPLVLTGGPAVGKTTTAGLLARSCARAAVIDVDDIRQLVVSGAAAPWQGAEGLVQQRLGVENACALARRFLRQEFEVVITDVLDQRTTSIYRRLLPSALIIRLSVSRDEARRRAQTRTVYLTDEEFEGLHEQDRRLPPAADHDLEVTDLDLEQQVATVADLWRAAS